MTASTQPLGVDGRAGHRTRTRRADAVADEDGRVRSARDVAGLLLAGPGGAVRLAGLVSAVAAGVVAGPTGAALMALVLAGLVVPVAAGVPRWLDAGYGAGLVAAAWAGALDGYQSIAWLDVVMHLVVTGLIAAVGHVAVARWTGAVADPLVPAGRAARVGSVGVTTALGLACSVIWEFGEYLGVAYVDPAIHVAYRDTIGDMAMGGLGSVLAGLGLALAAARARR
jgi:hypothetical protein